MNRSAAYKNNLPPVTEVWETTMHMLIGLIQLLVLSSALIAEPSSPDASGPAQPELGKWWKNSGMVKDLGLSETQVGQIEQIFLQHRPVLVSSYEELKKREFELAMLMKADPIDESKALSQSEMVALSRAALEKANAAMMLAIRKVLAKEQWEKLQEIRTLRASGLAFSTSPAPAPRHEQSGEKVYRAGKDPIIAPKVLYQPVPQYTEEARDAKIGGVILLQGIIRKNGRIDSLKVLTGLGYGLDESAVATVGKEWRFEPGTLDGQPVDVQANIEISFRLY
jgi:TonB family protein